MSGQRLSIEDLALCVAALQYGATDLRDGAAAGVRIGYPVPAEVLKFADEMDELRLRLLGETSTSGVFPQVKRS